MGLDDAEVNSDAIQAAEESIAIEGLALESKSENSSLSGVSFLDKEKSGVDSDQSKKDLSVRSGEKESKPVEDGKSEEENPAAVLVEPLDEKKLVDKVEENGGQALLESKDDGEGAEMNAVEEPLPATVTIKASEKGDPAVEGDRDAAPVEHGVQEVVKDGVDEDKASSQTDVSSEDLDGKVLLEDQTLGSKLEAEDRVAEATKNGSGQESLEETDPQQSNDQLKLDEPSLAEVDNPANTEEESGSVVGESENRNTSDESFHDSGKGGIEVGTSEQAAPRAESDAQIPDEEKSPESHLEHQIEEQSSQHENETVAEGTSSLEVGGNPENSSPKEEVGAAADVDTLASIPATSDGSDLQEKSDMVEEAVTVDAARNSGDHGQEDSATEGTPGDDIVDTVAEITEDIERQSLPDGERDLTVPDEDVKVEAMEESGARNTEKEQGNNDETNDKTLSDAVETSLETVSEEVTPHENDASNEEKKTEDDTGASVETPAVVAGTEETEPVDDGVKETVSDQTAIADEKETTSDSKEQVEETDVQASLETPKEMEAADHETSTKETMPNDLETSIETLVVDEVAADHEGNTVLGGTVTENKELVDEEETVASQENTFSETVKAPKVVEEIPETTNDVKVEETVADELDTSVETQEPAQPNETAMDEPVEVMEQEIALETHKPAVATGGDEEAATTFPEERAEEELVEAPEEEVVEPVETSAEATHQNVDETTAETSKPPMEELTETPSTEEQPASTEEEKVDEQVIFPEAGDSTDAALIDELNSITSIGAPVETPEADIKPLEELVEAPTLEVARSEEGGNGDSAIPESEPLITGDPAKVETVEPEPIPAETEPLISGNPAKAETVEPEPIPAETEPVVTGDTTKVETVELEPIPVETEPQPSLEETSLNAEAVRIETTLEDSEISPAVGPRQADENPVEEATPDEAEKAADLMQAPAASTLEQSVDQTTPVDKSTEEVNAPVEEEPKPTEVENPTAEEDVPAKEKEATPADPEEAKVDEQPIAPTIGAPVQTPEADINPLEQATKVEAGSEEAGTGEAASEPLTTEEPAEVETTERSPVEVEPSPSLEETSLNAEEQQSEEESMTVQQEQTDASPVEKTIPNEEKPLDPVEAATESISTSETADEEKFEETVPSQVEDLSEIAAATNEDDTAGDEVKIEATGQVETSLEAPMEEIQGTADNDVKIKETAAALETSNQIEEDFASTEEKEAVDDEVKMEAETTKVIGVVPEEKEVAADEAKIEETVSSEDASKVMEQIEAVESANDEDVTGNTVPDQVETTAETPEVAREIELVPATATNEADTDESTSKMILEKQETQDREEPAAEQLEAESRDLVINSELNSNEESQVEELQLEDRVEAAGNADNEAPVADSEQLESRPLKNTTIEDKDEKAGDLNEPEKPAEAQEIDDARSEDKVGESKEKVDENARIESEITGTAEAVDSRQNEDVATTPESVTKEIPDQALSAASDEADAASLGNEKPGEEQRTSSQIVDSREVEKEDEAAVDTTTGTEERADELVDVAEDPESKVQAEEELADKSGILEEAVPDGSASVSEEQLATEPMEEIDAAEESGSKSVEEKTSSGDHEVDAGEDHRTDQVSAAPESDAQDKKEAAEETPREAEQVHEAENETTLHGQDQVDGTPTKDKADQEGESSNVEDAVPLDKIEGDELAAGSSEETKDTVAVDKRTEDELPTMTTEESGTTLDDDAKSKVEADDGRDAQIEKLEDSGVTEDHSIQKSKDTDEGSAVEVEPATDESVVTKQAGEQLDGAEDQAAIDADGKERTRNDQASAGELVLESQGPLKTDEADRGLELQDGIENTAAEEVGEKPHEEITLQSEADDKGGEDLPSTFQDVEGAIEAREEAENKAVEGGDEAIQNPVEGRHEEGEQDIRDTEESTNLIEYEPLKDEAVDRTVPAAGDDEEKVQETVSSEETRAKIAENLEMEAADKREERLQVAEDQDPSGEKEKETTVLRTDDLSTSTQAAEDIIPDKEEIHDEAQVAEDIIPDKEEVHDETQVADDIILDKEEVHEETRVDEDIIPDMEEVHSETQVARDTLPDKEEVHDETQVAEGISPDKEEFHDADVAFPDQEAEEATVEETLVSADEEKEAAVAAGEGTHPAENREDREAKEIETTSIVHENDKEEATTPADDKGDIPLDEAVFITAEDDGTQLAESQEEDKDKAVPEVSTPGEDKGLIVPDEGTQKKEKEAERVPQDFTPAEDKGITAPDDAALITVKDEPADAQEEDKEQVEETTPTSEEESPLLQEDPKAASKTEEPAVISEGEEPGVAAKAIDIDDLTTPPAAETKQESSPPPASISVASALKSIVAALSTKPSKKKRLRLKKELAKELQA
ncbi:titin-like [Selaginella moellendorffii]|uniref:titin-like n=1 Tax=Selaginella moellendorffii TaxID=88036 RepID=UPI000D1C8291|nr:titin-like [Selaginella moellendorffii]|eukprot:XP_024537607.1 titin-like [Selaginella moellendorffii]